MNFQKIMPNGVVLEYDLVSSYAISFKVEGVFSGLFKRKKERILWF